MILHVHLEGSMLRTAREGSFNFMAVLRAAVEGAGWRVEWRDAAEPPDPAVHALFHMQAPPHRRALIFRRAYHYPFWHIEPVPQRWRFHVAQSRFRPETIDPEAARRFAARLRDRVLPGPPATHGPAILVPLQGHLRRCRSFQSMSPLRMLETVAASGRPVVATLHPKEHYDKADHAALQALAARHPNLRIGGQTATLLRDCAFVATENSGAAFDGYLLGKPAVLFAQIDFHHIGLNVAELGAARALRAAETHRPDFDRYLYWFLQESTVNATLPDAGARVLAAMRRGGWPI